jgi:uncharacterized protein (TIGR00369 family)
MATDLAAVLRAQTQPCCVVCGPEHPTGLRVRFKLQRDGSARAEWTASPSRQGFQGILHGGIVATLLDEAMSKAAAGSGVQALTAELRVRYRHHVAPDERLVIKGWIVEKTRRMIRAEASLETEDGDARARAWATFLPVGKA